MEINKVNTVEKYEAKIEQNDVVVSRGYILIDQKPSGRPAGMVEDVWTDENVRKQGLATEIVKTLINIAKTHKCYKVILDCSDENKRLYEKLGFKPWQNSMRLDL